MIEPEKVQRYITTAEFYLSNADKKLAEGELSKAGEFLWGAIAIQLKTIGALNDFPVDDHAKTIVVGDRVAAARNDPQLRAAIMMAEKLHANYYETFLREEEFTRYVAEVKLAYSKLAEVVARTYKSRAESLAAYFAPPGDFPADFFR